MEFAKEPCKPKIRTKGRRAVGAGRFTPGKWLRGFWGSLFSLRFRRCIRSVVGDVWAFLEGVWGSG